MSQGRMEDALKVFKKIYRINTGKSADEYPVRNSKLASFGRSNNQIISLRPYYNFIEKNQNSNKLILNAFIDGVGTISVSDRISGEPAP